MALNTNAPLPATIWACTVKHARVLGDDAERWNGKRGSFGINGPRTEQFAIGSNLYCMVYGFELQGRDVDRVIDRCWRAQYAKLQDLLEEVTRLHTEQESQEVANLHEEQESLNAEGSPEDLRLECEARVQRGLLQLLEAQFH